MIDTWYSRCVEQLPVQELSASCTADVCIVGAGLAGLTSALELTRRGQQVVVLEAERLAFGASGRNGGFVSPGFSQAHQVIIDRVGEAHARDLHAMSIEGVQHIVRNIRELQIDKAAPVQGIMRSCRYPAAVPLKARRDWLAEQFDYSVDYLDAEQLRSLLLTERYHDALLDRNAFHINPLAYAQGLATEIRRLGGVIHEESAVQSINGSHGAWSVETAKGAVKALEVVVTTGGYTGNLVPGLQRSFLPIATYVMLTEANPELVASAINTPAAIVDDRRASDYYRVVDEGRRILWGGKITTRTSEPRALSRLLHESMVSTYPQLADLQVESAWSGMMSYARHRMPQIGQLNSGLKKGLWHCTAFGGHGLNTTAIGGQVIAEAITGESDRYRQFAPFGLEYTGGILGRAAVQATYWQYQIMDAWRERANVA